jgi:tetratricopeptide (TPR) repeat protein
MSPDAFAAVASRAVALLLVGIVPMANADELSDVQRLYYAGKGSAAMERAERYLVAHPKDPSMRFLRGVMLSDSRRDAQAIAEFEKLIEDYPDLAEPYNNLGALYAASGELPRAQATLQQALRINPAYATAHENLGDVYAALANQAYARALQVDPKNTTVVPKIALVRELYKRRDATVGPGPAPVNTPSASASASASAPAPVASAAR